MRRGRDWFMAQGESPKQQNEAGIKQELESRGLSLFGFGQDNWHGATAFSGGVKDGVSDGRGDGDDGSLASAGGGEIGTVEQMDVEFGNVVEARHFVFAEGSIKDF